MMLAKTESAISGLITFWYRTTVGEEEKKFPNSSASVQGLQPPMKCKNTVGCMEMLHQQVQQATV